MTAKGGKTIRIASRHFGFLLASLMIVLILAPQFEDSYVSAVLLQLGAIQEVVGAICVYFLIGLAWATIYSAIDCIEPQAFAFNILIARLVSELPGPAQRVGERGL